MAHQDQYVALFPLLADHWDKPLSKLPKVLRARVGTKVVKRFAGHQPKFDANGEFERDAEGRYPVWEEVYSEHEVGDFPLGWNTLTPAERQEWVRGIDYKNDPALAGERLIEGYNHTMDARTWWKMQNVTPKDAAMVLCRINPLVVDDPEHIYVDGDISSPDMYRLLLKVFESVASTALKPRMLLEWRAIAQQHDLCYHAWIDDYADAMGVPAEKQAAPEVRKNKASKASDDPPGITDGMVAITKLAITAAWEIECKISREATAKEVIKRLQEMVTSLMYAELIEIIPHGVTWMTSNSDHKPYRIDACRATLKKWNKSRA